MHRNVETWERLVSVAAGAGLVAAGWRRSGVARRAATTVGTGLIARGVSGYCPVNAATGRGLGRDDTREALGGTRGVFVRERITIDAPVGTLFEFWSDPSNLPRLLPYLRSVESIDDRRSHWVLEGPAGSYLEWDAEVINEVPFETIGWRSLPGADVASAGSVRFRRARRGGTDVTVTMQYAPPAGRVGAVAAWLTGHGASSQIREALRQLKRRLETTETPTVGSSRPWRVAQPRHVPALGLSGAEPADR
jgi:uncharacterized membrane protein